MQIEPLFRFVLVEPIETKIERDKTLASGIILSETKEDRADLAVAKAQVLAIGEEVTHVKKDDIILYNYFSGNQLIIPGKDPLAKDDKKYHLVYEEDILGRIND